MKPTIAALLILISGCGRTDLCDNCYEEDVCRDGMCLTPCVADHECGDDRVCGDGVCTIGVASPSVCVGCDCPESCVADEECDGCGDHCILGRCAELAGPAEPCELDRDCVDGAYCVAGICRLGDGEVCSDDADCLHHCSDGLCFFDTAFEGSGCADDGATQFTTGVDCDFLGTPELHQGQSVRMGQRTDVVFARAFVGAWSQHRRLTFRWRMRLLVNTSPAANWVPLARFRANDEATLPEVKILPSTGQIGISCIAGEVNPSQATLDLDRPYEIAVVVDPGHATTSLLLDGLLAAVCEGTIDAVHGWDWTSPYGFEIEHDGFTVDAL